MDSIDYDDSSLSPPSMFKSVQVAGSKFKGSNLGVLDKRFSN